MVDDLYEDMERVKIRFIAAYEKLVKRGLITDAQFEAIIDAVDRIDELTDEEVEETLGLFKRLET